MNRFFNRTLIYALLIAAIGAAYVFGVAKADAAFGLDSDWLAAPQVAAAGLLAVLFDPIRRRLESWADRLVYGRRISAGAAVAEITALGHGADGDAALRDLARIVALGLGTASAAVRLDLADGEHVRYAWPEARLAEHIRELPISYQGAVVGALELPSEVAPRRRTLVEGLTRSAGVVLHNAGLTIELEHRIEDVRQRTAEIAAARWRIVAAQDSERRELERDLHDGAQPGLTAVRLGLGLVTHLAKAGKTEAARRGLRDLIAQIDNASAGLHQTLRGLDPEVLRTSGLAAALGELVDELGVAGHAEIADATEGLRFRADLEAAAYFCCAEAIQNAAKHSPAAALRVLLAHGSGQVRFEVRDEGPGFEVEHEGTGSGLRNMVDRAEAVGGGLTVESSSRGTIVAGWIPLS
ncbi:MAG TPA: ATP-binding protein [Actinospica sp.]|nr:ATP-binding protein [Actinospica sp.]